LKSKEFDVVNCKILVDVGFDLLQGKTEIGGSRRKGKNEK